MSFLKVAFIFLVLLFSPLCNVVFTFDRFRGAICKSWAQPQRVKARWIISLEQRRIGFPIGWLASPFNFTLTENFTRERGTVRSTQNPLLHKPEYQHTVPGFQWYSVRHPLRMARRIVQHLWFVIDLWGLCRNSERSSEEDPPLPWPACDVIPGTSNGANEVGDSRICDAISIRVTLQWKPRLRTW